MKLGGQALISTVQRNLVANFVSNGCTALIAILLIPVYMRFLGIEAWGVIGIFVSLQSICLLLDLGLSATLNRELARLSVSDGSGQQMRNLLRTLELIYWTLGILIGVSIFALAPLIAGNWVQAKQLSTETIEQAIRLMGLTIALQWPFGLYSGGLSGLQRQVSLSTIIVGIATIRGLGSILILWKISPTLQAFFLWQLVVSLLQSCLTGWSLWKAFPPSLTTATFQRELLRDTWRFTAGMSGIIIIAAILFQMDKVILSKLLSLEEFGYYVLASAAASGLFMFVFPVMSALFPRFTQLVSVGDEQRLKELYHRGCQLMSVLLLPIAMVIAFYSREILFLWTANSTAAEYSHLVLACLAIGTALNGLMHLPYTLQMAYGRTKLILYINVISVFVLAPSIVLMASRYGAIGAALVWFIFNCTLVLIGVQLIHRQVLKGEQWKWYFEDFGIPLAVSLGATLFCSAVMPRSGPRFQLLMVLAGVTFFVISSTFLATPVTRVALVDYFKSWRRRATEQLLPGK